MFDGILKDYDKNKKLLEKQEGIYGSYEEQIKKQLQLQAEPITKKILHGLNANVAILHANEKVIERETKLLLKETAQMQKEAANWAALYNSLNETLKKVGDITNFANIIEQELSEQ